MKLLWHCIVSNIFDELVNLFIYLFISLFLLLRLLF